MKIRKYKTVNPSQFLNFLISYLLICIISSGCAPQSHLVRGKQYLDDAEYESAVKELEKASREAGDIYYYIDTYSSLGDAYTKSGRPVNAMSVYRNALQIIHLRLREITSRRLEIRRELNSGKRGNLRAKQDEEMRLSDEEWKLTEKEKGLKARLKTLTDGE